MTGFVLRVVAAFLMTGMFCSGTVFAAVEDECRSVIDANKAAVVTVQIVTETTSSFEGETAKEQNKTSATGTVIDPSGLVVTSLTAINPRDRFHDFMFGADEGFSTSTRVVDAKIRLDDGVEVPADVVLRDRDLDMAFLRPKKAPEKPFAYVDLSTGVAPQVFDQVVVLMRLGQIANRSLAASIERVSAVLTKPRASYFLPNIMRYSLGYPTFAVNGKPVGVLVLRASMNNDQDRDSYNLYEGMLPVVMPCTTVMAAAEQAKTAKPEAEAAHAAKEPEKAE